jgi:hypothetical protein
MALGSSPPLLHRRPSGQAAGVVSGRMASLSFGRPRMRSASAAPLVRTPGGAAATPSVRRVVGVPRMQRSEMRENAPRSHRDALQAPTATTIMPFNVLGGLDRRYAPHARYFAKRYTRLVQLRHSMVREATVFDCPSLHREGKTSQSHRCAPTMARKPVVDG